MNRDVVKLFCACYCCRSCTSYGHCHDSPNGSIISCGCRGLLKGWVDFCNGLTELYCSLDVRQIMPSFNFWPCLMIKVGNSWKHMSNCFDLGAVDYWVWYSWRQKVDRRIEINTLEFTHTLSNKCINLWLRGKLKRYTFVYLTGPNLYLWGIVRYFLFTNMYLLSSKCKPDRYKSVHFEGFVPLFLRMQEAALP